jgi:hypothetical protein
VGGESEDLVSIHGAGDRQRPPLVLPATAAPR